MSDDKMFFTTSDLMEKMNSTLRNGDTENFGPQFELQKRLPDGSTRRANDSEMAMADFQSKLKQVRIENKAIIFGLFLSFPVFITFQIFCLILCLYKGSGTSGKIATRTKNGMGYQPA